MSLRRIGEVSEEKVQDGKEPNKNAKGRGKINKLVNHSISEAERMKEYVEDQLNPYRSEVSKAFQELEKIFDEDDNLQQGMMVKSLRAMQTMHENIVKKYSVLKVSNNKNKAKLESQVKLNKHLEDTLSSTIRDKDDADINLKTDIRVLEQKLEDALAQIKCTKPDETVVEQE